jgi:hypothetical protein
VTWTDEELRAGGWAETEIIGYRAGVASAEARFAEMESRPSPAAEDRVPGELPSGTELRALEAAERFVARAERAHAEAQAEAMSRTVVRLERPGDPPAPDIVRANALAHIRQGGMVIARPGPHNAPRLVAMRDATGEFKTFTAGAMPEMTLITPANAGRLEYAWEWAQRRDEDEQLIAAWGLAECQRAGVLVTGAVDAGQYAKLTLPPGVKAL